MVNWQVRFQLVLMTAGMCTSFTITPVYPSILTHTSILGQPTFFGTIPYGSYILGKVLEPTNSCCSGCSGVDSNSSSSEPLIFLIPIGPCAPDCQVFASGNAGADAVLFYYSSVTREFGPIIPSGQCNARVPSAAISFDSASAIKSVPSPVFLNLTFDVAGNGSIGLGFYLNGYFDELIADLIHILRLFDRPSYQFSPYFYLLYCHRCPEILLMNQCICAGKYCSSDTINGAYVVQEVIRQMCVYNESINNGTYAIYYDYMEAWFDSCISTPKYECTKGYAAAGLDANRIDTCYNNSFTNIDRTDNSILRNAQAAMIALSPVVLPAVTLGGKNLYGDLSPENINRAICASTLSPSAPCQKYFCSWDCWPDMLTNGLCDPACNVTACGYDSGQCLTDSTFLSQVENAGNSTTGKSGNNTTGNSGNSTSQTPVGNSSNNATTPNTPSVPNPSNTTVNNTSPTNSSSPASNNTVNSTTLPQTTECSLGCTADLYYSETCQLPCNVSGCEYQNWTCACAPGCTPELLSNSICDSSCNTRTCNYDNYTCTRVVLPFPGTLPPFAFGQQPNGSNESSSDWVKWVAIAVGLVGLM